MCPQFFEQQVQEVDPRKQIHDYMKEKGITQSKLYKHPDMEYTHAYIHYLLVTRTVPLKPDVRATINKILGTDF